MNISWIKKNTFHYSDFRDLKHLVEEKEKKNHITMKQIKKEINDLATD